MADKAEAKERDDDEVDGIDGNMKDKGDDKDEGAGDDDREKDEDESKPGGGTGTRISVCKLLARDESEPLRCEEKNVHKTGRSFFNFAII